jgi:hypothetical protein
LYGIVEEGDSSAATIRVAAYLGRKADANCVVGVDESGRPIAEPKAVGRAIGLGESTVYKALMLLDRAGWIVWDRATTPEKFTGLSGRVRLVLDKR